MAFTQYCSFGVSKGSIYYPSAFSRVGSPRKGINSLKSASAGLLNPKCRREAGVLSAKAVWKLLLSASWRRGKYRLPASLTVEAALSLPLLLFAFLALFGYFRLMDRELQVGGSLAETGKQFAEAAYVGGQEGYLSLRRYYSVEGQGPLAAGARFAGSTQVGLWPWLGYTAAGSGALDGASSSGQMVYRTPAGEVYHTNRDCSYLRLSVEAVAKSGVEELRNLDGSRYQACGACGGAGDTVYITDYGAHYHSTLECSGLKRTVLAVPLEETAGMPECRKCAGGGNSP